MMAFLATPTRLTGAALAAAWALAGCGGGNAVDAPAATAAAARVSSMAGPEVVLTSATVLSAPARLVLAPAATAPVAAATPLSGQIKTGSAAALNTDTIFAPNSFWYTAIPANAPLHANSANFVTEFLRQKKAYYGNVNLNTTSFASPVYIARADTPTTAVGFNNCQNKTFTETGLIAQWTNVPIPAVAAPADGSDAEMTVYQPSTDTLWEFWVTKKTNGAWSACWGGKMNNVSANDGTWPAPYGTTATGLPFLGGQITAEELARGEIRHAIGISLVDVEHFSTFSWPARRSDGYNPTRIANRIPEGLRMRLDPAINVDALSMTPVGKIIAKAAQKYGFVIWDKAGALSLRLQNPKSYTALGKPDPYPALFAGKASYAQLDGLPWDRLQFMPMNYGKP
jgi:hypothetical protein